MTRSTDLAVFISCWRTRPVSRDATAARKSGSRAAGDAQDDENHAADLKAACAGKASFTSATEAWPPGKR
jgi:hypothetical protein